MAIVVPESFGALLSNAPKHFSNTTFQQRSNSDAERDAQRRITEINAKNLLDRTALEGDQLLQRELIAGQNNRDYLQLQADLQSRADKRNALRLGLMSFGGGDSSGSGSGRFAGSDAVVNQLLAAGAPLTPTQLVDSFNGMFAGLNQMRANVSPWSARTSAATNMGMTYLNS